VNTAVIPIQAVNDLRERAHKAMDVRAKHPDGWSKCRIDLRRAVAVFSSLRIKPGYALRAYVFRAGDNGNGVVWAMPADAPWPEPEPSPHPARDLFEPPRPDGALKDYMEAIDGDGTPMAYMSASLLARELAEFGALWHGCSWDAHAILGANPVVPGQRDPELREISAEWTWNEPAPAEWQPVVDMGGDRVRVTFHTFTGLDQERILRHTDVFSPGRYSFQPEDPVVVAVGGDGYVF
jgi:hypothetical protein